MEALRQETDPEQQLRALHIVIAECQRQNQLALDDYKREHPGDVIGAEVVRECNRMSMLRLLDRERVLIDKQINERLDRIEAQAEMDAAQYDIDEPDPELAVTFER